MLHAASSQALITRFQDTMGATYRMKHLGTPQHMVGIKVTISRTQIKLSQDHYIATIADRFAVTSSASVSTPATTSGCLAQALPGDSTPLDPSTHPYMSLVGSLLWASLTRPDIATAVGRACQHSKNPTAAHWRAALRILKYLYHSRTLGLRYVIGVRPARVSAFADAAFANEASRRSRYGFAVFVGSCLVSWLTKSTSMVCLSTAESEFIAATEAAKDVIWLRGVLNELGLLPSSPSVIYEDNQACVSMITNGSVTARNRHFCVKMAWLRQQVELKTLVFEFVPSKRNLADIFTKILALDQFVYLRDLLFLFRK